MLEGLRLIDLILAPSETVRQRFNEYSVPGIELTSLGIDQAPSSTTKTANSHTEPLRIGFFGSLMVSKAPHLVMHAFATLQPDSARLNLYGEIASYHGDESYRSELEHLFMVEGITHRGPIPHSDVPSALAELDVVVMPSVWLENSPLVIREAFLAGVPVIASDHGGMREMIRHEVDGLLFEAGNIPALARNLRRLIDEPELLKKLQSGIPAVRSIKDDATELRRHYSRLVNEQTNYSERPRLAAVVLNFRTPEDTLLAVRSLNSSHRPFDEIIVVDNGSGNHSVPYLRKNLCGPVLIENKRNLGFSGGCNVGIRSALERGADLIFLLNADAIITTDTIGQLERSLDNKHPITGPVTLHRSDPSRIATAGISFSKYTGRMLNLGFRERFDRSSHSNNITVDALAGSAMLIRREVFDAIGLFDEDYFFSFEDIDFCLRARAAGFNSRLAGNAITYHAGSASIGPASPDRLYYSTRNHLLLAKRTAPLPFPLNVIRAKLIVMYNLAHGLRAPSRVEALRAIFKGTWHGLAGRGGRAPSSSAAV